MSSDGNEASKPSSSSQLSEFNQSISILSQKFKSISSEECFQQERYSLSSVIFKWITIVLVINCAFELTVVIILYYGGLELLDDMDEIFLWSLIFFPVCAVIVILEYILLKKANFRYERGALIITAFYIGWLTYPNYGEGGTEGQTLYLYNIYINIYSVIIIAVSAIILGQHICYSWIVATGVMALNALIQIIYHGITGDLRSGT